MAGTAIKKNKKISEAAATAIAVMNSAESSSEWLRQNAHTLPDEVILASLQSAGDITNQVAIAIGACASVMRERMIERYGKGSRTKWKNAPHEGIVPAMMALAKEVNISYDVMENHRITYEKFFVAKVIETKPAPKAIAAAEAADSAAAETVDSFMSEVPPYQAQTETAAEDNQAERAAEQTETAAEQTGEETPASEEVEPIGPVAINVLDMVFFRIASGAPDPDAAIKFAMARKESEPGYSSRQFQAQVLAWKSEAHAEAYGGPAAGASSSDDIADEDAHWTNYKVDQKTKTAIGKLCAAQGEKPAQVIMRLVREATEPKQEVEPVIHDDDMQVSINPHAHLSLLRQLKAYRDIGNKIGDLTVSQYIESLIAAREVTLVKGGKMVPTPEQATSQEPDDNNDGPSATEADSRELVGV